MDKAPETVWSEQEFSQSVFYVLHLQDLGFRVRLRFRSLQILCMIFGGSFHLVYDVIKSYDDSM